MRIVRTLAVSACITLFSAWLPTARTQAWEPAFCAAETPADESAKRASRTDPAMCCPSELEATVATTTQDPSVVDEARRALASARLLGASGRGAEALQSLEVVERGFPRVADRVGLMRGRLLLDAGRNEEACDAFRVAAGSVDSTVRVLGEVAVVRCLLLSNDRRGPAALASLLQKYVALPDAMHLRYELASMRERMGDTRNAASVYRSIDLEEPGSTVAGRARERLAALSAAGVRVRPFTLTEEVDRAERLVRSGPITDARVLVDRLAAERLTGTLRARLTTVASRLARFEGRSAIVEEADQPGSSGESDGTSAVADAAPTTQSSAVIDPERAKALRAVKKLRQGRAHRRVPTTRLLRVLDLAVHSGLDEEVDATIDALSVRDLPASVRLDAALLAMGTASDELLLVLLKPDSTRGDSTVAARYHYARLLERMGRNEEAEREYLEVLQAGSEYYGIWAEQRLWSLREAMLSGTPSAAESDEVVASHTTPQTRPIVSLADALAAHGTTWPGPVVTGGQRSLAALTTLLEPIVAEHGEAFPWFARAYDLIRLDERDAAVDEIHEAYLAWREARGRPLLGSGLEAVYRGTTRPRQHVSWKIKRERRELVVEQRQVLAELSAALGDVGTAIGWSASFTAASHPRPYIETIERAARRHGVDPNLLYAVMRVESVYQPRIVSYAGAVGLMQIMPRTGGLIAGEMRRTDYTTAHLLEPEVNLDFAAWYLASLLDRFDGRLPLAIAAYNGGPHNVNRWIRELGKDVPLDVFLERIPYTQTHRYVRRVLTHYAAYRSQLGLPMQRLSVAMPTPRPDTIAF